MNGQPRPGHTHAPRPDGWMATGLPPRQAPDVTQPSGLPTGDGEPPPVPAQAQVPEVPQEPAPPPAPPAAPEEPAAPPAAAAAPVVDVPAPPALPPGGAEAVAMLHAALADGTLTSAEAVELFNVLKQIPASEWFKQGAYDPGTPAVPPPLFIALDNEMRAAGGIPPNPGVWGENLSAGTPYATISTIFWGTMNRLGRGAGIFG